jgi:hypothetical protein
MQILKLQNNSGYFYKLVKDKEDETNYINELNIGLDCEDERFCNIVKYILFNHGNCYVYLGISKKEALISLGAL